MEIPSPIGQEKIRDFLKQSYNSDHLHHALLFAGPQGTGKEAVAFELARNLVCETEGYVTCGTCLSCYKLQKMEHPDFDYLFPMPSTIKQEELIQLRQEKYRNLYHEPSFSSASSISIERIRELKKKVSYKSYSGRNRVVVIVSAEKMGDAAANSILKLLEEPPDNMYFILTVNESTLLLPTIRSRCQLVRFPFLLPEQINSSLVRFADADVKTAEMISLLCNGNFKKALDYLNEDIEERRNIALDLLTVSLKGKTDDIIQYADEISSGRNIGLAKEILSICLLIVQGALNEKYSGQMTDSTGDILRNKPPEMLNFIAGELEKAVDLIGKNVYLYLVILTLMLKVKEYGK